MSNACVWKWITVVLLLLGVAEAPAHGVVDGVPISNTDRRFDGVGILFTVTPWVGCAGWTSGTCTLIAPNVVLLARHCLDISPSDPLPTPAMRTYRVRFRRAVDGTSENALAPNYVQCHGVYQEISIVQLVDAPNNSCDQVLGYLASAPVGIQPIVMELSNPPHTSVPVILAGWGYDGECYGAGNPWTLRSSRGILPANWSTNDYLEFSWCSVGSTEPCLSCPSMGGPFVNANLHDSGAPVLMEVPSSDWRDQTPELRLIGTVSSTGAAHRPSAWNDTGGLPLLVQNLPAPHLSVGDFDGNGVVDVQDVMRFLSAFLAGRMDADADGNGVLAVSDVLFYIRKWFDR